MLSLKQKNDNHLEKGLKLNISAYTVMTSVNNIVSKYTKKENFRYFFLLCFLSLLCFALLKIELPILLVNPSS